MEKIEKQIGRQYEEIFVHAQSMCMVANRTQIESILLSSNKNIIIIFGNGVRIVTPDSSVDIKEDNAKNSLDIYII